MSHEEDSTNSYRIKDILFFGSPRRILLQSANGPCPLLAICNVLLLRNQLSISQDARYITFGELVEMVSGRLLDANARAQEGEVEGAADVREALESALEILPRLNVGLDVNCKFAGPTDFEYTRELAVFDLLDICLFHGWVVSSQDEKAHKAFAHLSYNQVVEKLVALQEVQQRQEQEAARAGQESPTDGAASSTAQGGPTQEETAEIVEQGLLIQDFLERTANQLSYDGLLALHSAVRERQLAVFFRNSHFSTMLRYEGDLYLLCTDIAFAYSHVVWEKLDEVDGDTSYCDCNFRVNEASSDEAAALAAAQAAQDSMLAGMQGGMADADHLLALQLMQEDLQAQEAAQRQALLPHQQQQQQRPGGVHLHPQPPPPPPQQQQLTEQQRQQKRPGGGQSARVSPDQRAPGVESKSGCGCRCAVQ